MEWPDSWPTRPTKETRLSARRFGWPPKSSNSRLMTPRYCSCGIPVKWEGGGLYWFMTLSLFIHKFVTSSWGYQFVGKVGHWNPRILILHEKNNDSTVFLNDVFSCTRCMNSVMIVLVVILTLMMFFRLTSGV